MSPRTGSAGTGEGGDALKTESGCTRCRSCGFWVRRTEKTCPNCGIAGPAREHDEKKLLALTLVSFAASAVALIVLFTLFLYIEPTRYLKLLFLLPAALAVPGIVSVFRFVSGNRRSARSFLRSGDAILSRIRELDELTARINGLREHVKNLDTGERKRSLSRILSETAIEIDRYARDYRIQLCRYEVIRWYNGLLPLSAGMDSGGEAESTLSGLTGLIAEGERLQMSIVTNATISESAEGRGVASDLRVRIAHCRDLYEEALTIQARNLLRGLSPSALSAKKEIPAESLDADTVETDIRDALLSLSGSFTDLESEYERFREELRLEKL